MYEDVIDLRDFYASSVGQVAQRVIRGRLRQFWPDLGGCAVLGIGYAAPFLRPLSAEAERMILIMPAQQGALRWPLNEPNQVALSDDAQLPLPDQSVDRVLVVHAIERTEQLRPMLREIWRVLAPNGRMIAVVPNRRGIWARLERTPYGGGSPFSPSQLSRLLRDSLFLPMETVSALHLPPTHSRMLLAAASAVENVGARWFPRFGGVLMVEAMKQIYAIPPALKPAPEPRFALAQARLRRRPQLGVIAGSRAAEESSSNNASTI